MNLEEAREQARRLFPDLAAPSNCPLVELGRNKNGQGDFFEQIQSMSPSGFPFPGLLLFGLTALLGLRNHGHDEKVRWSVFFATRNATFGFEHRKFGLRMLCEPDKVELPVVQEVLGKARALTDIAERYLAGDFAATQINAGHFTMENLFRTLDERYRYLRQQAETAYSKPPPPPETHESGGRTWYSHDTDRPAREGGALGTAAVDAYFSRIEHLFCLAAAFQPGALPTGGIIDFLSSNWPAKARAVLDLGDPTTKGFYDKLLRVREEWRNPLAHGGFLSGGGSLHFHLPGVGALPARLRRTPDGVRLGFRLHASSFGELVTLFDDFDAFLEDGPLRYPWRWAEAGLDVCFDPASRGEYQSATESDATFDSLIDFTGRNLDRHNNMDY